MTVLIFPSNIRASLDLLAEARRWGQRAIGSSSLEQDPNASFFDSWERLPYVGDPGFFDSLAQLAERHRITGVMTPHAPSYFYLAKLLPDRLPQVRLIGESPYQRQMQWVDNSFLHAKEILERVTNIVPQMKIDPLLVAALLSHAENIFGECSDEKIVALCSIFSSAPTGDVIEIGSFYGKSAYVLNRLASYNGVGTMISVDSWKIENSVQYNSPPMIQELATAWNWEGVFSGFLLTMLANSVPPFNYIRESSRRAWEIYNQSDHIKSPEFGSTSISGQISVLHIDGNHDEKDVRDDFSLWSTRLTPGGWIIFDDYHWPHGNGPRIVADEAVAMYGAHVEQKLLAGGALFLKIGK